MASNKESSTHSSCVITIDGPAGAGKSTVAKRLAKKLKLSYLDTGAMYRALTLKALQLQADLEDENQLVQIARDTVIDLKDSNDEVKVFLDGADVSQDIRAIDVTNKTFYIAGAPRVREIMVEWQRSISQQRGIVVEGRDVGTVVFPNASFKFYLDADGVERSKRRIKELKEKGEDVDDQKITKEIKERDQKDLTRTVSPLKKADDAIFIDSTNLSIEEVISTMLTYINN